MTRRQFGTGAIGPVFCDDLLAVVQVSGVLHHLIRLGAKCWRTSEGRWAWTELIGRLQGKRRDLAPMWRDECLHHETAVAVRHPQRLPARGINNRIGRIDRRIARVVRIRYMAGA